jgi:hypothetical protein
VLEETGTLTIDLMTLPDPDVPITPQCIIERYLGRNISKNRAWYVGEWAEVDIPNGSRDYLEPSQLSVKAPKVGVRSQWWTIT